MNPKFIILLSLPCLADTLEQNLLRVQHSLRLSQQEARSLEIFDRQNHSGSKESIAKEKDAQAQKAFAAQNCNVAITLHQAALSQSQTTTTGAYLRSQYQIAACALSLRQMDLALAATIRFLEAQTPQPIRDSEMLSQAIQNLFMLIKKAPSAEEWKSRVVSILNSDLPKTLKAEALFHSADTYPEQSKLALSWLDRAEELTTSNELRARIIYKKAAIFSRLDQHADASSLLEGLVQDERFSTEPTVDLAKITLARKAFDLQQFELAKRWYLSIPEKSDLAKEVAKELCLTYLRLKDSIRGLSLLEKMPADPYTDELRIAFHIISGDTAKTRASLQQAKDHLENLQGTIQKSLSLDDLQSILIQLSGDELPKTQTLSEALARISQAHDNIFRSFRNLVVSTQRFQHLNDLSLDPQILQRIEALIRIKSQILHDGARISEEFIDKMAKESEIAQMAKNRRDLYSTIDIFQRQRDLWPLESNIRMLEADLTNLSSRVESIRPQLSSLQYEAGLRGTISVKNREFLQVHFELQQLWLGLRVEKRKSLDRYILNRIHPLTQTSDALRDEHSALLQKIESDESPEWSILRRDLRNLMTEWEQADELSSSLLLGAVTQLQDQLHAIEKDVHSMNDKIKQLLDIHEKLRIVGERILNETRNDIANEVSHRIRSRLQSIASQMAESYVRQIDLKDLERDDHFRSLEGRRLSKEISL